MISTDPRSAGARQAAEQALADAEAAATAASEHVDFMREEVSLGRAERGDLVKARNALARAQEATEQGRAAVRAIARAEAERSAQEQASRESVRVAAARELAVERDELEGEIAAFFAEVAERAAALDEAAKGWDRRALSARGGPGGIQPGRLYAPSNFGAPWARFNDGVAVLARQYPAPRNRER